jgi:hypothetical protein
MIVAIKINTQLLIAAPMLQDLLVDKNGLPMANGTITLYHDLNRSFLKNWYYQTGAPGSYTFTTLPNPLTLSAAGTICDINGVDTIPFYYPYLETDESQRDPYYIVILSADGQTQITRSNFPYLATTSSGPLTGTTFNNLIVNNGFWRNLLSNTVNNPATSININNYMALNSVISLYYAVVAPSQHDGFSMPDIQFIKNNLVATDTITFTPFPLILTQPISNTIVPEYYVNHVSNAGAMTGETVKYYQFPISLHINPLSSINYTVTLQAQSIAGPEVIVLKLLQYTGTGTTPPIPVVIQNTPLTLTPAWAQYSLTDLFPAAAGLALGNGGDDAYYLQVSLPVNTPFTINFTKPCLYLTNNIVPALDFTTYDQVDAIINSPRTGDIRTSINSFYPFGWVPMNNGTIGNTNSNATSRGNVDCWPLFNLLWQAFQAFNSGSANPLAQMVNSSGAAIGYGVNAITDFTNGHAITLTKAMGQVIMGTVPLSALLAPTMAYPGYTGPFTALSVTTTVNAVMVVNGLALQNLSGIQAFLGMPFTVSPTGGSTLPTGLVANTIYYAVPISSTQIFVATSFSNAITMTTLIGFTNAGTGTFEFNLAPLGSIEGEYDHTQLETELATHHHPNSTIVMSAGVNFTYSGGQAGVIAAASYPLNITNDGNSVPFNVTQPGSFFNLFMKL